MIDFILKVESKRSSSVRNLKTLFNNNGVIKKINEYAYILFSKNTCWNIYKFKGKKYIVIGDLIVPQNKSIMDLLSENISKNLKYFKGFFYLIEANTRQLKVFTSIFNILPLFYYFDDENFYVSAKAYLIVKEIKNKPSINKRFIIEQILFNYAFFNNTIYKEIKTIPANYYIEVKNGGLNFIRHTKIEEYFISNPIPWKKSIENMSDLFLETVKDYFPDEEFFISFTGGFDGRTLVATAKKFNKKFKTYSFGTHDNEDIIIPLRDGKELDLDFVPVYLTDNYTKNHFINDGKETIRLTDGNSSFLHVHYLYSAKYLSKFTNYVINGMFGSELFRALHIRGQVTSEVLVDFFLYDDENEWIKRIQHAPVLNYLNKETFKNELNSLINDLLLYKKKFRLDLNRNQFFYKFIFEEAFRKVFGNFIIAQLPYVMIRSPYLDFNFIKNLLKTELAGANNEFFTHNPVKRFKGQVLYAHIIERSFKPLYHQITGKGYRPKDLISPFGKLNLVYAYLLKRLKRKLFQLNIDNLGIISGIKQNNAFFRSVNINEEFYNKNNIEKLFNNTNWTININLRDILIQLLSVNYFINEIFDRRG